MKTINQIIGALVITCLFAVSASSCSGNKKEKQESKQTEELIKQEMQEVAYTFPSMFEMTALLNEINASYIITLSNSPSNVSHYVNDKSKALNLGSYALDLAYAATYNRQDEVKDYFGACETLVDELDLTDAFDSTLPEDIRKNLNNKEELVKIISGMFEKSYAYLNEQGRPELSYLVVSGSVFEGLYLATNISENVYNNPSVIKAILSQKESIAKLQSIMEKYKDTEEIKDVYQKIVAVNDIYNVTEGTSGMTEGQIKELTKLVADVRATYIK